MILVLGGTKESHDICDYLLSKNIDFTLSVATDYALQTFEAYKKNLIMGRMDKNNIINFCKKNKVSLIIDITHPYAFIVSQNAIDASLELGIDYFRYERQTNQSELTEDIFYVQTHEEAIELGIKFSKDIFLTVGSNNAGLYSEYINKANLYIRILPKSDILKKCEDFGYINKNIIAMQGPFSKDINKAMLEMTNSKVLITKDSGDSGGFMEKLEACQELGIKMIIVERPSLDYPRIFEDINDLIRQINVK